MKRDMDLIRNLMLRLEAKQTRAGAYSSLSTYDEELKIGDAAPDVVAQHVALLFGAGYLEGEMHMGPNFGYRGITWQGYDFLDSVRDPEVWAKTKEGAAEAGGFTVDLLKALAKGFIKKKIEQHTGVELDL